ncbi:probable G-protein coupled receptor 141 [Rhineura floridana]|uniref:probable G-protein coupled receptor 141 n=1 Tax=Rhineura floridana TaxID=261503 RepID=UPI002AC7EB73|nr:probable G-protein coupled receptor 141 [Rhineura floridana]XP_061442573.1 probable G-protein coupled receptor 141 [Rhineura floridana]
MAKGNEPLLNSTLPPPFLIDSSHIGLITTYTMVFIAGVCGVIKMSFLLVRMNTLSVTTTAVINLVVIHSFFLVTVPFRLYYYATDKWTFGLPFCKFVSGMIHFHMYLTFLFYMIFLVIRCLIFFQWKDKVEFYRNLHAVATSTAVWILAFVIVAPIVWCTYGTTGTYGNNTCFRFHQELERAPVKVLNYVLITVMVSITCTLLGLQVFMLLKVVKKLSGTVWSHQEFWAQLKSFFFVWVIMFCFLPHHFFRIYFIEHVNDQQLDTVNEIFLSITAISCLDLFSFVISGSNILRQRISALSCC